MYFIQIYMISFSINCPVNVNGITAATFNCFGKRVIRQFFIDGNHGGIVGITKGPGIGIYYSGHRQINLSLKPRSTEHIIINGNFGK